MADFMLEPDEIEDERSARARPPRYVSTGLAPTADVPMKARGKEHPPCYAPCDACGAQVLTCMTGTGLRLVLDTHIKTYTVSWEQRVPLPLCQESRGYPVHQCRAREGENV